MFGLAALFGVAFAAAKPPTKGITYRLRMSSRLPAILAQMGGADGASGPLVLARVKAIGNRARLDFLASPVGLNMDDYVLILDSSRMVFVSPEQKTYTDASALVSSGGGLGMLSSMAGGGRRARGGGGGDAGGGVPALDINGLVTDLEQLDGDTLDGRQVQHYRIVAEMNVAAMGQMLPLRIVMEMWTANLPTAIVNPFDLSTTVSPTDPAAKLTSKLIELRKKIQGTPVKTVTTMTITGFMGGAGPPLEFVQTTAVTDIKEGEIDERELQIPVGFTKKGGS